MVAPVNPVARAFPHLFARGLITVAPTVAQESKERTRERSKLQQRELRAYRRANDLCIKCGGVRVDGLTLCEKHRRINVEAARKSRGYSCSRA